MLVHKGVIVHSVMDPLVRSEQQMPDPVWTSQFIGMSGMHWAETEALRRIGREIRPVMTAALLGRGRFTTRPVQRLTLEGRL